MSGKKYSVTLSPAAERQLRKLTYPAQKKISEKLKGLVSDPRPHGVEKLTDATGDFYRLRSGDYRIIYTIQDFKLVVLIVKIGDRKEVYRRFP